MCLILIRTYGLNFGGDLASGAYYDRYNVGLVTVGGMLLVSLPLLISYLWSTSGTYQPFLEIIYNTLGFVLFLTVGSLALDHYRNWATPHSDYHHRGDMGQQGDWNSTNATDGSWTDKVTNKLGIDTSDNISAGKALGVDILFNLE